jgi:parallel beta-helix repeat protein
MRREIAAFCLCLTILLGMIMIVDVTMDFTMNVKGATLYVNMTGSDGAYTSVQDAINASKDGDTLFVYQGTYNENIVVNKTINLIGENMDLTTINGSDTGDVVIVSADFVNISGFTIKCGGPGGWSNMVSGTKLENVSNCKIFDNIILDCYVGINLYYTYENNVNGNNISYNEDGIWLLHSSDNVITYNTLTYNAIAINGENSGSNNTISHNILSNNEEGIWLLYTSDNVVSNNNCTSTDWFGIYLDTTDNISVINNTCSGGFTGIDICDSSNITIIGNTLSLNSDYGISAQNSFYIDAYNNNISDSWYGIYLFYTWFGNISHNNITSKEVGIELVALSWINATHNDVRDAVHGIRFWSGYEDNIIANNSLSNNTYGIWYDGSYYDTINNNIVFDNEYGIHIWWSNDILISHNQVFGNDYGIYYWENTYNTNLTNNNVSDNEYGIFLDKSDNDNNLIMENLVSNNEYAINISQSNNNAIYHNNFINNTYQAYDDSVNKWDNDYPLGGNYWSDYVGLDYYKGTQQNMPGSDGIGDTNYTIDIDSLDNYPLMEQFTSLILENFTILEQGWNLISIPLIQEDENITKVLEMIDGYYDWVQWYDASDPSDPWKNYIVEKPYGNDLLHLNETMGFWIHITHPENTIFLYNGTQPTDNQTIKLYEGWNMVGYPSLTNYNRTAGLNNLTFDIHVDAIWTYNAATKEWIELGPSDYFELERGYYIHAKTECEWEVPL